MPRLFSGAKTVYSTNDAGQLDVHVQKDKLRSISHTTHKINSKWIRDLNDTIKTMKNT